MSREEARARREELAARRRAAGEAAEAPAPGCPSWCQSDSAENCRVVHVAIVGEMLGNRDGRVILRQDSADAEPSIILFLPKAPQEEEQLQMTAGQAVAVAALLRVLSDKPRPGAGLLSDALEIAALTARYSAPQSPE